MKLYLVKIVCLGQAHFEVRGSRSSCDAIVDAMCRYPQASGISARRMAA